MPLSKLNFSRSMSFLFKLVKVQRGLPLLEWWTISQGIGNFSQENHQLFKDHPQFWSKSQICWEI